MLPDHIRLYWRVRNKLRLVDMAPMLDDRTLVPLKLRGPVLETLHSAHQGVLGMGLSAEQAVYWPGCGQTLRKPEQNVPPVS